MTTCINYNNMPYIPRNQYSYNIIGAIPYNALGAKIPPLFSSLYAYFRLGQEMAPQDKSPMQDTQQGQERGLGLESPAGARIGRKKIKNKGGGVFVFQEQNTGLHHIILK